MEEVVLVDSRDRELGTMEKMKAHQQGKLHRAFSIMLLDPKGNHIIQKRADGKYHSAGLWSNACCSHPFPGEPVAQAVRRRLKEEMGIELQPSFLYKFIYKVSLDKELIEHELDHVYWGVTDQTPQINSEEVQDWRSVSPEQLREEIANHPEHFTPWFLMIMHHFKAYNVNKMLNNF